MPRLFDARTLAKRLADLVKLFDAAALTIHEIDDHTPPELAERLERCMELAEYRHLQNRLPNELARIVDDLTADQARAA